MYDFCIPQYLYRKRREIYRIPLPEEGHVVLTDGSYEYLIRKVRKLQSPKVAEPPKQENPLPKVLAKSTAIHAILLILLGLFISLPRMNEAQKVETRFVHLDTSTLINTPPLREAKKQITPKKPNPPKKTKALEPQKTKASTIAKKSRAKKIPRQKRNKVRRAAKGEKMISSSPHAGGGSGRDGNVSTRNVKQAGILGILGDSVGSMSLSGEALAAVTNLDAVTSPGSTTENFKVGGIVGRIDSSNIEIPSGRVVQTRGTHQVLRSVGAKGEGHVAALKKGKTGQNTVRAMVSVDLDNKDLENKVRIRGGMSREAVKRVIDQHLDDITVCYENALLKEPTITGTIVFEWKILLSGRVGETRIKTSSIKSNDIHSCIKAAIKSWQFPKPQGSQVMVSYPFVFDIVGF
jgi:hypothetical protein